MIPTDPLAIDRDAPLYGARAKVARANHHLMKVGDLAQEYLETHPNPFRTIFNPDDQSQVVTLDIGEPPVSIGLAMGDCIHNMRAALDLMAVELTRLGLEREGKEMSRTKLDEADFRICAHRDGFEATFEKMTRHWSEAAKDFTRELEPFKDGSHAFSRTLWNLNKLDILDKHHLLIPVGMTSDDVTYSFEVLGASAASGRTKFRPRFRVGKIVEAKRPLQRGDEVLTLWADEAVVQIKVRSTLCVAFGQDQVVGGEAVMDVLSPMVGAVDYVVENMAARA